MLSKIGPSTDQLEITLIGPGYGECVVIHCEGEWIVIDSCRDARNKRPGACEYLTSINVDASAVKLVACTHWHDDHIGGLSEVFQTYKNAAFCLSGALKSAEFAKVAEIFRDWHLKQQLPISSGMDELTDILTSIRESGRRPSFAIANRQIWQSPSGASRLVALSPSDETTMQANAQFATLVPGLWTDQRRARDASPNHIAVAMHLVCGVHTVLLGSDLEEHGNPHTGWSAVVADSARPQSKASLYKVAHHGSETAEHPRIWADLLKDKPITVMSPFSKALNPLPTAEQRAVIKTRSARSFVSADLEARSIKRRGPLGRIVGQRNLRLAQPNLGWVRARTLAADPTAVWEVEYAGDAVEL